MLNPNTDKFYIEFSKNFYENKHAKKYDDYLFHMNSPIKTLIDSIKSTIQNATVPGFNVSPTEVLNLANTQGVALGTFGQKPVNMTETSVNRSYIGNRPFDELLNSKVININFKNNVINWMYFYEYFRDYYSRKRTVEDFTITFTVMDTGEIPQLQFIFSDCFIVTLPDLEFVYNQVFGETKSIDVGFAFNKFDVKFLIPGFNKTNITL